MKKLALVGLGLVAMSVGLVVGPSGCLLCDCPDLDPVEPGLFQIVGSPDRPELVGGLVEATDEGVEISFEDAQGTAWVITYSIEYKIGD
jgi:hypothetical protein